MAKNNNSGEGKGNKAPETPPQAQAPVTQENPVVNRGETNSQDLRIKVKALQPLAEGGYHKPGDTFLVDAKRRKALGHLVEELK